MERGRPEAGQGDPAQLQTQEGRPQTPVPTQRHAQSRLRAARERRLVHTRGVDAPGAASGPGMGRVRWKGRGGA